MLKRSRHAASESQADMADAAEFYMIVSEFLTRQKAKTKRKPLRDMNSDENLTNKDIMYYVRRGALSFPRFLFSLVSSDN